MSLELGERTVLAYRERTISVWTWDASQYIGYSLEDVMHAAARKGTLATESDMRWILKNQWSPAAQKMIADGGTFFFLGDGVCDECGGADHIHQYTNADELWTHHHALPNGWRRGDRVVFLS